MSRTSVANLRHGDDQPIADRLLLMARTAISMILIVAAIIKATGLIQAQMDGLRPVATAGVILIEIMAGVWLITGWKPHLAWWMTTLLFCVFLGYSVWGALSGADSCGCLGDVTVSPIVMASIDAAVLAALLWMRERIVGREKTIGLSLLTTALLASIALGAVAEVVLSAANTSPGGQASEISGGEASASEPAPVLIHDLGYVVPGGTITIRVAVHNRENQVVSIVSVDAECVCTTVKAWPREIAPGESGMIDILFEAPDLVTPYAKKLHVMRDGEKQPWRTIEVRARLGLPLLVQPESVVLQKASDQQQPTNEVTVTNQGTAPIRLLYGRSEDGRYIARVPRRAIAPASNVRIPIAQIGDNNADGDANRETLVQIQTDSETQPIITVRVQSPAEPESNGSP